MSWFQLRPTFELTLVQDRRQAMVALQRQSDELAPESKVLDGARFVMKGEYAELHLPENDVRLWSPHLSISVNDGPREPTAADSAESQRSAKLYCRFAPRFHVWSFVWAVYLMMTTVAFFSLILAASQAMMGWSMWGLYVAGAAMIVVMVLSLTARIGQSLSVDQMGWLRQRLDNVLIAGGLESADKVESH